VYILNKGISFVVTRFLELNLDLLSYKGTVLTPFM